MKNLLKNSYSKQKLAFNKDSQGQYLWPKLCIKCHSNNCMD